MIALPAIRHIRPARPANEPRPPVSAQDRLTLIEIETLAGSIEDLDRARQRDRITIKAVTRLIAQPAPACVKTATQPEGESLEYRIMSGLATFMGAAAIITIAVFALSLLTDLPGLLTREIAP